MAIDYFLCSAAGYTPCTFSATYDNALLSWNRSLEMEMICLSIWRSIGIASLDGDGITSAVGLTLSKARGD